MQAQVTERATQFVRSKLGKARGWLMQFNDQVEAMLSSKVASTSSQDNAHDPGINLVSNFESLLMEFQSLLIWESPVNSAFALTAFTCLYWLVILWSPRLLSIIAVLFFCYHFYEMWTRYLWPEIRVPTTEVKENWTTVNPNVLSAPEIKTYLAKLNDLVARLFSEITDLRRRSHGTFSFLSITFLAVFYYLGKYIPGVVLVYSFAILLFLTPGFLLYVLPHHLLDYCNSLASPSHKFAVEEATPNCEPNDLCQEESGVSVKKESAVATAAVSRESSLSPPHYNSHFDDNFFESENTKSKSSSTSDLSDDFEIISDTDLREMELK